MAREPGLKRINWSKSEKKVVSISLEVEVLQQVEVLAKTAGQSVSWAVNQLLETQLYTVRGTPRQRVVLGETAYEVGV